MTDRDAFGQGRDTVEDRGHRVRPVDRKRFVADHFAMLNEHAAQIFTLAAACSHATRTIVADLGGGQILDAGVHTPGSLAAGLLLARLCLGGAAEVELTPADPAEVITSIAVSVRTDQPLPACLGAQYAGWPVQSEGYFAMGSGPMRMLRGREQMLEQLSLSETGERVVGVLESDKLPAAEVVEHIAEQCGVATSGVQLAIAPSTSLAGSIQVVARSIETALHKLHALDFAVESVVSATGIAPLPPPAKPGDTIAGIGRTNDAVLYGARVTLWTDCNDDEIEAVAERVPSHTSPDHGRPFAEIFKGYDFDFYKVDPLLFSPAEIRFHNLRSGRSWSSGKIETELLRDSFWS